MRYGPRESSEKEQLNHSKITWFGYQYFDEMYDEWDDRKRNQITVDSVELHRDEVEITDFSMRCLYRKSIYKYRLNVINLMEEYFEAVNLVGILNQIWSNPSTK